jgi:small subunit ribosomal protein S2
MTKREGLILERKIEKLQLRLGGIRDMRRLPDVLLVVDTRREHTAVKEANILGIPVMALVDTNCNPDTVDYVIPANDDAMRAIKLLVSAFADAVIEGRGMRKDADEEEFEAEAMAAGSYDDDEDEGDERYLGESTLAKLREQDLFEEGDDDSDDDEE